MEISQYLKACQDRTNQALERVLPAAVVEPQKLHAAMRYAVFNGGKRLRSAFIYTIGEELGAYPKVLDQTAAAVEMVHAFSLIHDDLPALDNDDLRRGKPACHRVYGEATAILAGDALQTLAFETLTKINKKEIDAAVGIKMIKILAHSIGSLGMAGGEELDIEIAGLKITLKKLATIYKLKTSHLIYASAMLGALAANCHNQKILLNLQKFGIYIGLAFQIHDDIIEIESDATVLGKPKGSDIAKNKPTFPSLLGLAAAKEQARIMLHKATLYLNKTGINNEKLIEISNFIIKRSY